MRYQRLADRTGARWVAPGLIRFTGLRHLAESLFRQIEKGHAAAGGAAAALVEKLGGDQVLTVGRRLQVLRLARAAEDFDIPVAPASHKRREGLRVSLLSR